MCAWPHTHVDLYPLKWAQTQSWTYTRTIIFATKNKSSVSHLFNFEVLPNAYKMVIASLHSFSVYETIIYHTVHIILISLFNLTIHILNTLQIFVWPLRSLFNSEYHSVIWMTKIYISILLQKHKMVTSQIQSMSKLICCNLYTSVHISLWMWVLNTFVGLPKIITNILYSVDRLNFERCSTVYQVCIIFIVGESVCCYTNLSAFGDVSIPSCTYSNLYVVVCYCIPLNFLSDMWKGHLCRLHFIYF